MLSSLDEKTQQIHRGLSLDSTLLSLSLGAPSPTPITVLFLLLSFTVNSQWSVFLLGKLKGELGVHRSVGVSVQSIDFQCLCRRTFPARGTGQTHRLLPPELGSRYSDVQGSPR